MRNLALSLLVFLGFVANAQQTVDVDVCTEFVQSKINELNLKIWNAAVSEALVVYSDNTLSTLITPENISSFMNYEKVVRQNPKKTNDIDNLIDSTILYSLDPDSCFVGVCLYYKLSITQGQLLYKLEALAPLWEPFDEWGHKYPLNPMFYIKIDDLMLLMGDNWLLYQSLFATRAAHSNFFVPDFKTELTTESLGNQLLGYTVNSKLYEVQFSAFSDSILGYYYSSLFSFVAEKLVERNDLFFRDSLLVSPYKNIKVELADSLEILIQNPDTNADPNFISVMVKDDFRFHVIDYFKILNLNKRIIVLEKFGEYYGAKKTPIYFSYSSIKHLLQSHDRIVLEALLREIAK